MTSTNDIAICFILTLIQSIYSQTTKPPNIIFVVADDLGWDDMSYSISHQVISPTIAKFRSEARLLEYYYGQPVCAPTRTSIHTGRYPCHTGINTNIVASYSYCPSFNTKYLPLILREYANYTTHAVGKWHCGYYKWRCTPTFRGYESFFGYYTGGEDHYSHTIGKIYDFHLENGINCGKNCSVHYTSAFGHYATYYFTDQATEIIKNHSRSDSGRPLFLYLAYQNVHLPAEAPPKYLAEYNVTQKSANNRTIHCAQATTLDASFKNVTDVLAQLGYLNDNTGNTVIIFTSDNGGLPVSNGGGYNWPLRGGKIDLWEGGTRLQAWLWATKDIMKNKDKLGGGNYTQLSHVVDWLPTLVEGAAGVKISDLNLNYTLDGVNQWEGLIGDDDNVNDKYFGYRDNIWYGHDMPPSKQVGNNTAYRSGWMKLFNGTGGTYNGWYYPPPLGNGSDLYEKYMGSMGEVLLYNISNDPNEYKDLANDTNYATIVQQLWKEMVDVQETCIQLVNDSTCPKQTYELITIPDTNETMEALIPWCGE
eukprot:26223_1